MEATAFTWSFPGGFGGLVAFSALVLAIACASYSFTIRKSSPALKSIPLLLRILALALIVFCLCSPTKVLERKSDPKAEKPKIALLVDSSSSMALKGLKGRSRLEESIAEAQALMKERAKDFDFTLYSFSSAIKEAASLDAIASEAGGKELRPTALFKSIASWTREKGGSCSAAVCFSDGIDTSSGAGIELALDALESGAPPIVFAVAGAPLKSKQSVEILRIEAPDGVKPGSEAQVATVLRCSGLDPSTPLEVKVSKGGKVVWSEKLDSVSRGTFTKALNFSVPIKEAGMHSFVTTASVGGRDEAVAKWGVCGIEEPRLKVLLYTGSLDWGVRFLRRAFESSENISLDIRYAPDFLGSSTGAPQRAKENFLRPEFLEQYDAAIFIDLRRDQIAPDMESRLREYVSSGASLLFLVPNTETAEAYASTPIEKLLPLSFESASDGQSAQLDDKTRQFLERMKRHREGLMMERSARAKPGEMELPPLAKLSVTEAGIRSGIFSYAMKDGALDPLGAPSFEEFALVKGPKPGAEVLATHPDFKDASGSPRALLAVQRFGLGRSALLATDPLWRWRMTLDSKSRYFESFWGQLITWLCAGRESRPRWLLNSLTLDSGKPAQIRFAIPPRTVAFKELSFFVECEGQEKPLAMKPTERADQFEGEITPLPGKSMSLRAKKDGAAVAEASITGGPAPAERELEMLRPDVQSLRRMAAACGGTAVERLADVDFKKFMPPPPESVASREETPLWHSLLIIAAIMALLLAEMLVRRKLKMV